MPIGRAARARAPRRDDTDDAPTAADAFWSEDSAALHDAVHPPSAPERRDPPTGLVPPVAGRRIVGRRTRAHRGPMRASLRLRLTSPRRSLAVAAVLALVTVAVLGATEGPAGRPSRSRTPTLRAAAGFDGAEGTTVSPSGSATTPAQSESATGQEHRTKSFGVHAKAHGHPRTRARGAHPRRSHTGKKRQRVTPRAPATESQPTVTEASASPAPQEAQTTGAAATTSASSASTIASTGSKPAPAPAGPTRLGAITGGCAPKCN